MGLQDKAKAVAKKVAGNAQEAAGNVTNNEELEAEGKAKKADAEMSESAEDVKDTTKDAID